MKKTINEKQVRNVLAVYTELERMPYSQLNKFLGSVTIEEMIELRRELATWYQLNVHDDNYRMGDIDDDY